MIQNYLKIAVKVMLRRKFFTGLSLFGIAFTLTVLLLATAVFDQLLQSGYPETRLERMLIIHRAEARGPNISINSSAGFAMLDRYARDLPGVEKSAFVSEPLNVAVFSGGNRLECDLRRLSGDFFGIMDFHFLEGGPFTAEDEGRGAFVAVINERTRQRVFRGQSALGQTLRAGGQVFTVVGVVRDVPRPRILSFSEIWVPVTTAKSTLYRHQWVGGFFGILLAENRGRFASIKSEFRNRLAGADLSGDPNFKTLSSSALTMPEVLAGRMGGEGSAEPVVAWLYLVPAAGALLFMFLPAVNLVNLNLSRILERCSEIGVRKSFGASSRSLVGQFLVENVLLTLIGGAIGLAAAAILAFVFNASEVLPYLALGINVRVFAWAVILSVLFGCLSGVYPAWRMSRMQPVDALRGRA